MKEALNELGKDLHFDEGPHIYTYKGEQMTSVTTILKDYFKFDADKVKKQLSESTHPKYGGVPVDEIQAMWDAKAQIGTDAHNYCEDYFNGKFVSIPNEYGVIAHNYISKVHFEDVIPEAQIVAPEWGIAGMVDLLIKRNGKWEMWDWKTDKAVRTRAFKKSDKCAEPLGEFDNCNYNKYTMQLGVYRFILRWVYGIEISRSMIVHFNAATGTAKEYELPYYEDYVAMVIKKFVNGKGKDTKI